ncbi:MAG TPA: amidase [Paracoccaceae bacterium]|nr:amidase [Paracoccaceae bacterium]
MTRLPPDPLEGLSLADYARLLRQGEISIENTTARYLDRIELLDRRLGAFEHVARSEALATARALDHLLAAGTDLGPLMGVPIGIKDLLAVDSMPVRGGSNLDVTALAGKEGSFVKRLRAAGCVILGKTSTVEFAFDAVGINASRGTPWNPADPGTRRIPGGSSSGSAVAVAAGMAALAIGTDTGGSVRIPAALCGITGLKTSDGRWPSDGVLALSPTFDTIGLLCRSVADADLAFSAIEQSDPLPRRESASIRLGRPKNHYFGNLEKEVADRVEAAIDHLRNAGVQITEIEVPAIAEGGEIFMNVLGPELLARLGRDRFAAERDEIDPMIRGRIEIGHYVQADSYIRAIDRRRELVEIAARKMTGLDGWITPSVPILAAPLAELEVPERALRLGLGIIRNTQPGNLFAQCGLSIPIPGAPGSLPVGLQIMGKNGSDADLLAVGRSIERILGLPAPHDVAGFLHPCKSAAARQGDVESQE